MIKFFVNLPPWAPPALAVLGTSFLICMLLMLTQRWHGHLSYDHDLKGAQKIHKSPVPRIGGLGLFGGLAIGGACGFLMNGQTHVQTMVLLACALPVFVAGLTEDLTKRVTVAMRLIASFFSAALAMWLLDARLPDLDTPGLDFLIQYPLIAALFTCFAVGGMTNSVNIIDGLNGLAAGSVSLMLAGLGSMAWLNQDAMVTELCLLGIAAMVGFLVLNYPFGRIFLGDGGAYLAGFWVAECGVLLLMRNPAVSTWAVLLACVYPVWETIYSMYRRRVVARVASGEPDQAHLHQLLFKQSQLLNASDLKKPWMNHGMATALVWALVSACQLMAVYFNAQSGILVMSTIAFAFFYNFIYQSCQSTQSSNNPQPILPVESINS